MEYYLNSIPVCHTHNQEQRRYSAYKLWIKRVIGPQHQFRYLCTLHYIETINPDFYI